MVYLYLRVVQRNRAKQIIEQLNLVELPRESGLYQLAVTSQIQVLTQESEKENLAVQNSIYYMLTEDYPVNYLHWLSPDDTHILVEGDPVDYYLFFPDGHVEKQTIGRDLSAGQRHFVFAPGGCWKALKICPGTVFALMYSVVSPQFTPDRVVIGAGDSFIEKYVGKAPWATEQFLRELIGPNYVASQEGRKEA